VTAALGGGGAGDVDPQALLRLFILQIALVLTLMAGVAGCAARSRGHYDENLFVALALVAVIFQWNILCRGAIYRLLLDKLDVIYVDTHELKEASLSALSFLLALPLLICETSLVNLLLMAIVYVMAQAGAKIIVEYVLMATDPGGGMAVHLFGPFFGW